jgi:hypothetical protein
MTNISKSQREMTVKIAVSPLQWGEQPGNLRFSIYVTSEKIPVGALSIGGTDAYRLQDKIFREGALEARVLCGGSTSRIVLTQILGDDGWMDWREAVSGLPQKRQERILIDQAGALPAGRRGAVKVATV